MGKSFVYGEKVTIRRSPGEPVQEAYIDGVWVKIEDDTLGAWVLLSIRDNSGRPDEHVTAGAFLLARWIEMAES